VSRIYADSVTIQLTLPTEFGKEFLSTLLHSYLIAASVYFETDNNELRGFIQEVNSPAQEDVYKIIIYDSTLGGSGVLQEFVDEFSAISQKALQILTECSCDSACYKCLKTYFNQRDHNVLDKRLVVDTLQQFVDMHGIKTQEITSDDFKIINKPFTKEEFTELMSFANGEESPIEKILREAIERSDLVQPILQYELHENERMITKPDFAYLDQKIAIYADGYLYHKSKESFERDRNIDRWLQRNGWKTLRFPGGLIYRNVQICIADIRCFLRDNNQLKN
jgi:very-short-patch-repair endonuclease